MCGIAGVWDPGLDHDARHGLLLAQCQALRHRGPDGQGQWHDQAAGLGLAHTRLAIIDLQPTGAQPMVSASGRFALVFNGEIYNFQRLRGQLEAAGHTPDGGWRGHSDTEVLLAAVEAWGLEAALEQSVGMFALALWDCRERTLTLARDRLGKKPLYYGYAGGGLVFGSQLAPLLAHPACQRQVDRGALALLLRYLYIPEPHSIFAGVRKLPPASLLSFTYQDLAHRRLPQPRTYWDLLAVAAAGQANPLPAHETTALEALGEVLGDAVALRRIADVPLGAFLSGGIDSSLVVALMQAQADRPVRTFSIGFREGDFDEAAQARRVATTLATDHTELVVTPDAALDVVPELADHYDEPFADSSQLPSLLVARLARGQVTVAVSGDGGDELFGGYNRYLLAPRLWSRLGRLPVGPRRLLARLLRGGGEAALSGSFDLLQRLLPAARRQAGVRDKLQKVVDGLDAAGRAEFFHGLVSLWPQAQRAVVEAEPLWTRFTDAAAQPSTTDFAAWMMAMDQLTYLPGDILHKVDRATMAVGLEARAPFLDHRVVELAWRIPTGLKLHQGVGKWLLRRLLGRYLPPELLERPKQGFAVPLATWLRGPLRPWAAELLAPQRLAGEGFLQPQLVAQVWHDHQSGRRNRHHQLWALLMFQAWAQRWRITA